jgi:pilus assembly protein CpaB
MRSKSTILLLIALGCGMIASVGISQVVLDRKPSNAPRLVEIFVAVQDIDASQKITAEKIKLEKWPADRVPEGALKDLKLVDGKFANQRLYSGEPVLVKKLMDSLESSALKIPEGFRLVTLPVKADTGVAGLIRPGDRVDVVGFFEKSSAISAPTTKTVLENVRVFAIDSQTVQSSEEQGGTAAKTVSLLVRREDQEAWTWALELGKLRLSLRHPSESAVDPEDAQGPNAAGQEFLAWLESNRQDKAAASGVSPIAAPPAAPAAGPSPLASLLANAMTALKNGRPSTEAPAAPVEPTVPQDTWQMLAIGPQGTTVFHWDDTSRLPRAIQPEASESIAPPSSNVSSFTPATSGTVSPPDGAFFEPESDESSSFGEIEEYTE